MTTPDPDAELRRKIKTVLTAAYAHHGTLTAAEAVILRLVLDAERGVAVVQPPEQVRQWVQLGLLGEVIRPSQGETHVPTKGKPICCPSL